MQEDGKRDVRQGEVDGEAGDEVLEREDEGCH